MNFLLANIYGPTGVNLRARLYDPGDATVVDLALVEDGSTGVFGGTVSVGTLANAASVDDAYQWEVRQVSAQTGAAFTASTTTIITKGLYGYVVDGVWQLAFGTSSGPSDTRTGSLYVLDGSGNPVAGVLIEFRYVDASPLGESLPGRVWSVASDDNGYISATFASSSDYQARREFGEWVDFTTPASGSFTLPGVLGGE